MTKIILYKQDGAAQYLNVKNFSVEHGVLTFHSNNKKIVTTVPFLVEEDLAVAA
jgi:hypothetical protein